MQFSVEIKCLFEQLYEKDWQKLNHSLYITL